MNYKSGDRVRVQHWSGATWEGVIHLPGGKGPEPKFWLESGECVPESWLTPIEPAIAEGTLVEAWDGEKSLDVSLSLRFYDYLDSDGKHRTTTGGRWDHVRPIAVKARKWKDLTDGERTTFCRNNNGDDVKFYLAYALITGGSEWLIREAPDV
jgi:hypothetical protein